MDLFADLGALKERVELANGASLVVRGLTLADLTQIQVRFPTAAQPKDGDVAGLVASLSENAKIIGPIIAAGLGHLGDPAIEKEAGDLPAWVQAPVLAAIQRLTAPSRSPFVESETTPRSSSGKGARSVSARSSSSRKRRST